MRQLVVAPPETVWVPVSRGIYWTDQPRVEAILLVMIRGVVSPGPEASTDRW
ncbi:hypothetical protein ACFYN3_36470 [Streptomyces lavendulae]|uniref:hypothetical protein n=1 Tax=Streptomyces lavendulae TaxID=1914 RepID=UPI0036CB2C9C